MCIFVFNNFLKANILRLELNCESFTLHQSACHFTCCRCECHRCDPPYAHLAHIGSLESKLFLESASFCFSIVFLLFAEMENTFETLMVKVKLPNVFYGPHFYRTPHQRLIIFLFSSNYFPPLYPNGIIVFF